MDLEPITRKEMFYDKILKAAGGGGGGGGGTTDFSRILVSGGWTQNNEGGVTVQSIKTEIIIADSSTVEVEVTNEIESRYTSIIGNVSTLKITKSQQTHGTSNITFKAGSGFQLYIDGSKKNISALISGEVYTIDTWWEYVGPVYTNKYQIGKWDDSSSFVYVVE